MQLKFFTIPILPCVDDEEKLNKFLRSVRVLEIKRELVTIGDSAYWAVCVLYLPTKASEMPLSNTKEKVDYKSLLTESEFTKFCQLRKVRKQLADDEAVPAYAIFTDYELSEISRMDDINIARMKSVNGIGAKKIEKYGDRFCDLVSIMSQNETDGKTD